MKKISLVGLVLGAILGSLAALLAGGWIIWLGVGIAVGVVIGTATARRRHFQPSNVRAGNLNL